MNERERLLAILLVVAMVAVVGGFLGWQFVWEPMGRYDENTVKLRKEIEELDAKKTAIEAQQFVYETNTRKKSLPADPSVAQREYERLIDRMLRQAKFTAPSISPRPPDNKNVPVLAGKKPVYVKLGFDVTLKGELLSLVDFMHAFYRQPLLHQITKINIIKPTTGVGRELNITLSIEALTLDRADDRTVLLAPVPAVALAAGAPAAVSFSMSSVEGGRGTPFTVAGVLARGDDAYTKTSAQQEYRRIAGKNIFFDPLKSEPEKKEEVVEKKEEKEPVAREMDIGPYLGLVRVSHSDGRSTALIFDRFNKEDYEIEMNAKGEVRVTRYFYLRIEEANGTIGEVRKKYTEKNSLQFGSEEGGNLRRYNVVRVLENELLLETPDPAFEKIRRGPASLAIGGLATPCLPGKLHVWQAGRMLSNEDSKRAMKDLSLPWSKLDALFRPLNLHNEGDGGKPPDPMKPN